MKQFFDSGSPVVNMLNGFADSLKMIPPEELLDEASREKIKAEGLEILRSAQAEVKRRNAQTHSMVQSPRNRG